MRLTALTAFEDNYIWALVDDEGNAVIVDPGDAAPGIGHRDQRAACRRRTGPEPGRPGKSLLRSYSILSATLWHMQNLLHMHLIYLLFQLIICMDILQQII